MKTYCEDRVTMRVLVLGGTSFIGRATVTALLAHDHDVTICNRPAGHRIHSDAACGTCSAIVENHRACSQVFCTKAGMW